MQKLPLGAKESDIVLPDTLEVELEEADETLAEDSQNVHLVEAVDKGTEKDTEAETAVWQISGITWKLDEEQSDGSLRAVGGAYGAAGIGGNAGSTDSEGTNYGTGKIIIKGGTISADGGAYWVPQTRDYEGGAGIGTGRYGIGGTIEILGGRITAEGGRQTGAGIGGGTGGGVDTIVIGGRKDQAPKIAVSFYKNEKSEYLGAAIGSGWNGVTDLKLSCGDIQILSGSVKVTGGNIGYGVLRDGY